MLVLDQEGELKHVETGLCLDKGDGAAGSEVGKQLIHPYVVSGSKSSYSGVYKEMSSIFWLTNSALVCKPKCGGGGGFAGSQLYTGAPINFGDLTRYLTYASTTWIGKGP